MIKSKLFTLMLVAISGSIVLLAVEIIKLIVEAAFQLL